MGRGTVEKTSGMAACWYAGGVRQRLAVGEELTMQERRGSL